MYMKKLFLFFLLLSSTAFSKDFRTIDIGEPCKNVPKLEKALSTERIAWSGSAKERIAFKGEFAGIDTYILYFCPGGSLFTGNYLFENKSLEESLIIYRKIYDHLISTYGEARIDPTPWKKNVDPRWVTPDPREYLTWWKTDRLSITLSIHEENQKSDGWGVFVAIGPNKH